MSFSSFLKIKPEFKSGDGVSIPAGSFMVAFTVRERNKLGWGTEWDPIQGNSHYTNNPDPRDLHAGVARPYVSMSELMLPTVFAKKGPWSRLNIHLGQPSSKEANSTLFWWISRDQGQSWVKFDETGPGEIGFVSVFGSNLFPRNKNRPQHFEQQIFHPALDHPC